MRRTMVTLVLVLVVGGVAACEADGVPAPAPAAPDATTPSVPHTETATVCADAVKVSEAGATIFSGTYDHLRLLALADTDEAAADAKSAELEQELGVALTRWSQQLAALAEKDVDPQVNAALLDGARTVGRLNDPADQTAPGEARTTLERLAGTIEAACPAK
jgi:hypothetical protein